VPTAKKVVRAALYRTLPTVRDRLGGRQRLHPHEPQGAHRTVLRACELRVRACGLHPPAHVTALARARSNRQRCTRPHCRAACARYSDRGCRARHASAHTPCRRRNAHTETCHALIAAALTACAAAAAAAAATCSQMEDAATAEISRVQAWQWATHGAKAADTGVTMSRCMVRALVKERGARFLVSDLHT
jgi:Malate synthase